MGHPHFLIQSFLKIIFYLICTFTPIAGVYALSEMWVHPIAIVTEVLVRKEDSELWLQVEFSLTDVLQTALFL